MTTPPSLPPHPSLEERITALEHQVRQLNIDIDAYVARDRALLARLQSSSGSSIGGGSTTSSHKAWKKWVARSPQKLRSLSSHYHRNDYCSTRSSPPLLPPSLVGSPSDTTDQAVFGVFIEDGDEDDDEEHSEQQTVEQRDDVEGSMPQG